ncbi:hypothetical protein CEXT_451621 [Caerostris extrusa]|uniref:Transposase n=1 Tax=Caerostris extrusa TaxID=172846 RepID=A0AAV4W5Z7_CAEEX|nr:hypothetical protein CEXT_451621 [Caerostris extrusa]
MITHEWSFAFKNCHSPELLTPSQLLFCFLPSHSHQLVNFTSVAVFPEATALNNYTRNQSEPRKTLACLRKRTAKINTIAQKDGNELQI